MIYRFIRRCKRIYNSIVVICQYIYNLLKKVNWMWVVDKAFQLALFGVLYFLVWLFLHYNVTIFIEPLDTQIIKQQQVQPGYNRVLPREVIVKIKNGVNVNGLKPEIVLIFPVLEGVYKNYGAETVITSGVEGAHGDHSHHFKGMAVDVRTKNVQPDMHLNLVGDLRVALSDQYQVVYESNHIHIEFDPKHGSV